MVVLDVVVTRFRLSCCAGFRKPISALRLSRQAALCSMSRKWPVAWRVVKVAVLHVIGEQPGAIGGGVFVPFAIHEQHRHVDFLGSLQEALTVAVQQVADVEVHLPVFVQARS
jgi:hypothetical protein